MTNSRVYDDDEAVFSLRKAQIVVTKLFMSYKLTDCARICSLREEGMNCKSDLI